MKCPFCGKEMTSGVVQSARHVFFTAKPHNLFFRPNLFGGDADIVLTSDNWTKPTCAANYCADCRKVIIDC